jgi:hypothetical protein
MTNFSFFLDFIDTWMLNVTGIPVTNKNAGHLNSLPNRLTNQVTGNQAEW